MRGLTTARLVRLNITTTLLVTAWPQPAALLSAPLLKLGGSCDLPTLSPAALPRLVAAGLPDPVLCFECGMGDGMSAKHTQGPWEYDEEAGQVIAPKCGYQWAGSPFVVAEISSADYQEDAGNGRLIAAAPDLLAAATWAANYIDTIVDPRALNVLQSLRDAIGKAVATQKTSGYAAPFWDALNASLKKATGDA